MRNNNGNQTKKVTLILPESVVILDVTYYWKTAEGAAIKTVTTIAAESCDDGNEVACYSFPDEKEDE